jgi:hypothetical protein
LLTQDRDARPRAFAMKGAATSALASKLSRHARPGSPSSRRASRSSSAQAGSSRSLCMRQVVSDQTARNSARFASMSTRPAAARRNRWPTATLPMRRVSAPSP